jgi:hypothetical protein
VAFVGLCSVICLKFYSCTICSWGVAGGWRLVGVWLSSGASLEFLGHDLFSWLLSLFDGDAFGLFCVVAVPVFVLLGLSPGLDPCNL